MRHLGITRAPEQVRDLVLEAASRDIEVVALPLIRTESVEFELPARFSEVDWICFTSANGVRSFFERLKALSIDVDARTKIAAVGDKTSIALADFEHTPDFVPSVAYGKALFEELIRSRVSPGATLLFARAETVSFNPVELLQKSGVGYVPVVCYRTLEQSVDKSILGKFKGSDRILFTAPSAVEAFAHQFGVPVAHPIAIGESTAEVMRKRSWPRCTVMKTPDVNSILEYM